MPEWDSMPIHFAYADRTNALHGWRWLLDENPGKLEREASWGITWLCWR